MTQPDGHFLRHVGRTSLEDDTVQPGEETERNRVLAGVVLVAGEDVEHGSTGFDVGRGAGHELGVERRAQPGAGPRLSAQAASQHGLRGRHATRY